MVFEIAFHPEAELELAEAVEWYDAQGRRLGLAFWEDYLAVRNRLNASPNVFPIAHEGIRRANFRKFPYSVFFSIQGSNVFVYAVFHQKREPEAWFERVV